MNLFRSGWKTVVGSNEPESSPNAAETIERLVERIETSTLLDDRRDAARTLRSLARSFRLEVGAQAMQPLLTVMRQDADDNELVGHALDTLCIILGDAQAEPDFNNPNGSNEADEHDPLGEQFAEIFVHRREHVWLLIELLEEREFRVRWPAVRILLTLLRRRLRDTQDAILHKNSGIARLIDLLSDAREVIRNDAILLLLQLTRGHTIIQKIVAFENAFDRLLDIITGEGNAEGGVVVEDCLLVCQNLLRHNASNQALFREGGYANRLLALLQLPETGDWTGQREANVLFTLHVIRALVAPGSTPTACQAAQKHLTKCGIFDALCELLVAPGVPSDVLRDSLLTLADVVRGHLEGQQKLQRLQAPLQPPRPLLLVLMLSLVNERQPFSLRLAVLYIFESFLLRNPLGQAQILEPLLDRSSPEADSEEPSVGQLLCGALFAVEPLTQWLAAIALSHTLIDSPEHKQRLLRVQLAADQSLNRFDSEDFKGLKQIEPDSNSKSESVSDSKNSDSSSKTNEHKQTDPSSSARPLLAHVCSLLQQSAKVQTRVALLQLLGTWMSNCSPAVTAFLQQPTNIPFLAAQAALVEGDESEQLFQSLCAFVLGLCVRFNDNQMPGSTADDLRGLIGKRVGLDGFADKLSGVAGHDAYGACVQRPQIRAKRVDELLLDHEFCRLYRSLENELQNAVKPPPADALQPEGAETMLDRYKQLIRDQDEQMTQLRAQLHTLGSSHSLAQNELADLRSMCQQLKDQQALMRAADHSVNSMYRGINQFGCNNPQHSALEDQIRQLEAELTKYKSNQLNEVDQIILSLQQFGNLDFSAAQFQRLQQDQFQRLPSELQQHIFQQQNQSSSQTTHVQSTKTDLPVNLSNDQFNVYQQNVNTDQLQQSVASTSNDSQALNSIQSQAQPLSNVYQEAIPFSHQQQSSSSIESQSDSQRQTHSLPNTTSQQLPMASSASSALYNEQTSTNCTANFSVQTDFATVNSQQNCAQYSSSQSHPSPHVSPQHYPFQTGTQSLLPAPGHDSSTFESQSLALNGDALQTGSNVEQSHHVHSNSITLMQDKLNHLHLNSMPSVQIEPQPSFIASSNFTNHSSGSNVPSYYGHN